VNFKKWCKITFLTILFLSLSVVAFNFVVDPYDIYPFPDIEGLTSNKNIAKNIDRVIKIVKVEQLEPDQLVFGSSRAEIAIDPEHSAWDASRGNVYNFAFSSATIVEVLNRFKEAYAKHQFNRAVLSLDFFGFNANLGDRFVSEPKPPLFFRTLFSMNALKASQRTLKRQDPYEYPSLLSNGQIPWNSFAHLVEQKGHRRLFIDTERHYIGNFFPQPLLRFDFTNADMAIDTFAAFSELLHFSRKNQIELQMYISPIHARMLMLIWMTGLWPNFEDWKRQLVEIAAREAVQSESNPFELWDFSDINTVTTEAVPPLGNTQMKMHYYWECSHAKKETGDIILELLLQGKRNPGVQADFGVRLTRQGIEEHLRKSTELFEKYRATHPEDMVEVKETAAGFSEN